MGPDQDRLAREVVEVVIDQGGIWSSVEGALEGRYSGDELHDAMTAAVGFIIVYQRHPRGPAVVRETRDAIPEPEPARPRKRRWRVA